MKKRQKVRGLHLEIQRLRRAMLLAEKKYGRELADVDPRHRAGARNLLHVDASRAAGARGIVAALRQSGFVLPAGNGGAILEDLDRVAALVDARERKRRILELRATKGRAPQSAPPELRKNSSRLLGARPVGRDTRIMVTMAGEDANNDALFRALLKAGMNVMRINCARDCREVWKQMILTLRRSEKSAGRQSAVFMDLAGPKLRTAGFPTTPAVVRWKPIRDTFGRVVSDARIWLTPSEKPDVPGSTADAVLPLPQEWIARRKVHDVLEFVDARGAARNMRIAELYERGAIAVSAQTSYVIPGTVIYVMDRESSTEEAWARDDAAVAALPASTAALRVRAGDRLLLSFAGGEQRGIVNPAINSDLPRVTVTMPEVLSRVRVGERVWFDEGRIGSVVRRKGREGVELEVVETRASGRWLRTDRSINLPDSKLNIPAMTQKDREDLSFVARHADMVGLSFVHAPEDIGNIQDELAKSAGRGIGIVIKIENRAAVDRLQDLILAGMRSVDVGVLIARGDLAVECGFDRLGALQDSILERCHAARLPVFIATQVLESMVKDGSPSRAEIIDAACSSRAECVMLNKGPHRIEAVRFLNRLLHEHTRSRFTE